MAFTINRPSNGQQFPLLSSIAITGTSDSGIARVELWADRGELWADNGNGWHFRDVDVNGDGSWSTTYLFNRPGSRRITAMGVDNSGTLMGTAEVQIIVENPAQMVKYGDLSASEKQRIEQGFQFPFSNRFADPATSNNPKRWRGDAGQRARYLRDADLPIIVDSRFRSPEQIIQVIDYFNLEDSANRRYWPTNIETFCNIFTTDVMRCLRAPLTHWVGQRELDANTTFDWLNNSANGWRRVDSQEAATKAGQGIPALASWKNPGGIGHIAVVRPPEANAPNVPRIAQSGRINFKNGSVERGFGNRLVKFFIYG